MSEVWITAVITPAEGKSARVQELLEAVVKDVEQNEPDTLRYQLHKNNNGPEFVVVEKYKNAAAVEKHKQGKAYGALFAAAEKEGLVGAAPTIIESKPVTGFDAR